MQRGIVATPRLVGDTGNARSCPTIINSERSRMGIGTDLVERGILSEDDLRLAMTEQGKTGERLDQVLLRLGHVDAQGILEATPNGSKLSE